jgi:hypothetical protein
MFGRNGAKSRPARETRVEAGPRATPDPSAAPTTLLTMVATGNVEITATGRVSGNIETDSLVISQGGFFNGTVTKIREQDAHPAARPVHLVEEMRQSAQK